MARRRRTWLGGIALVTIGFLLSPNAVPIYDGIGAPDEPYRYVAAGPNSARTAPATSADADLPVRSGRITDGLNMGTFEQGPQFSLILPPRSLAATAGPIHIRVMPSAPIDAPAGRKVDGNVYDVSLSSEAGPVTLTDQAALATVLLRATSARQPGPTMYHRAAAGQTWSAVKTSRGGQDVYVAAFPGSGQFVLAFPRQQGSTHRNARPLLVLGLLALMVIVVVVIRARTKVSGA